MPDVDTALGLASRIRSGEITSVDLVRSTIARIDELDDVTNSIIWRNDDDALLGAERADARVRAGGDLPPFLGVPIPIKELNSVKGQPNTMGSLGISDAPREENDLAVDLLERAGFIFLGRSNSPEMGPMSVSENQRFGRTANPWDLRYSAGGSSGGAAAAVAMGLFPAAHASDGGGSIRMPSSCCGVVGLKPSRGRIPTKVPSWEASITEGAITRTVADTAALLDVMSAPDPTLYFPSAPGPRRPFLDEVGADGPRLRIGILLDAPTGLSVHPDCIEAAQVLAELLRSLGHEVFPASPSFYSAAAIQSFLEVVINASLYLNPYERPELAEPYIRSRMLRARDFHAGEYALAAARLHEETPAVRRQWGRDFDLLLTPTMATPPPLLGVVLDEANNDWDGPRETETRMISFTAVSNISGLPAINLPVHQNADGLPIGAQLIGGPFGEAELIRIAAEVEPLSGWLDRTPPLHAP